MVSARQVLWQAILVLTLPVFFILLAPVILDKTGTYTFPLEWYEVSAIFALASFFAFIMAAIIMFGYVKKSKLKSQQGQACGGLIINNIYSRLPPHIEMRKLLLIPMLVSLIVLASIPMIYAQSARFLTDPLITYESGSLSIQGSAINDGGVTLTDCRVNIAINGGATTNYENLGDIAAGAIKSFVVTMNWPTRPDTVKLTLVVHYGGTTYYKDIYEYSFQTTTTTTNGNGDGTVEELDRSLIIGIVLTFIVVAFAFLALSMGWVKTKRWKR